jgi:hypothetical protein
MSVKENISTQRCWDERMNIRVRYKRSGIKTWHLFSAGKRTAIHTVIVSCALSEKMLIFLCGFPTYLPQHIDVLNGFPNNVYTVCVG